MYLEHRRHSNHIFILELTHGLEKYNCKMIRETFQKFDASN